MSDVIANASRSIPIAPILLFPGQGAQRVGMGAGLYRGSRTFRRVVDRGAEVLAPRLGFDLRTCLDPGPDGHQAAQARLSTTAVTQPALFLVGMALVRLLDHWGVRPAGLLGHSLGELTAACAAGVFSFEDGLRLVATRAELMQRLPRGAMLAVPLPADELARLLPREATVATIAGPDRSVASGREEAIEELTVRLAERGVESRRLHTSHAFHSPAMDPAVDAFAAAVARVERRPPRVPFVSNVTGGWIEPDRAVDPAYWGLQLRATVRLGDGIDVLGRVPGAAYLEAGPGRSLGRPVRRRLGAPVLACLPHPGAGDRHALAEALRNAGLELGPDAPRSPSSDRRPPAAPRAAASPVARAVADAAAEVLGLPEAAPADRDFFTLGGDSLEAMRLLGRLRQRFGLEIPYHRLLESPTLADLAAWIAEAANAPAAAAGSPGPRPGDGRRNDGTVELSTAQERLALLAALAPEAPTYTIGLVVRLVGPVDLARLRRALAGVVARHEPLRTGVTIEAGRAVGRPLPGTEPASGPPLPVVATADADAAVARWLARPFPLAHAPLLRALAIRRGATDHVLVLALHHVAADGWSKGVLLREIGTLYRGEPLPPLPFAASDLASWHKARMAAGDLDAAVAFWRRELADLSRLDLPVDRPRRRSSARPGVRLPWTLPETIHDELSTLARDERTTPFNVLLAAFGILLARLSGQRDFAVGAPVAGRHLPGSETLVGNLVDTLPIRLRDPEAGSFRQAVARAGEAARGGLSHAEVPLGHLVEGLAPEREPGRNPFHDVTLGVETRRPWSLDLPAVVATVREPGTGTAKFDLALQLHDDGDRLGGYLEVATDILDPATASAWLDALSTLVTSGTEEPERPAADLPLLGDAARETVLSGAAGPPRPFDPTPVHQAVVRRISESPDRVAVHAGGRHLSYGALGSAARREAHRLAAAGIRPEIPVGLFADRSPEAVVGILAIALAGGVYVPLDPDHPTGRLAAMVSDARIRVVLASPGRTAKAAELASGSVLTLGAEVAGGWEGLRPVPQEPDGLAYALFTSGSTGRPKAVAVPQRGLAHLVAWHLEAHRPQPDDRSPQLASLSFDASIWELWPVLAAGATVHVPGPEVRTDPRALLDDLECQRTTTAFLPTPLAEEALTAARSTGPPLDRLLTGGDVLRLRPAAGSRVELINHYGPTECSVVATAGRVTEASPGLAPPSIGRPIDRITAHVLDRRMEPLPPRAPGEILLGGPGLARGYLGDPARTAERFVPHPFSARPGARLYRTGDLACRRHDGALVFLGRTDRQVKVRGRRIEPGEIEAALLARRGVGEAAVLLRSSDGDSRLVAFWSPADDGPPPDAPALRRALRESLPAFMVPAAFERLPALPRTPNGKVDRQALALAPATPDRRTAGRPPETPVERAIAAVWCDLLDLSSVSAEDDFFDLGGHSLSAQRVAAAVAERLGTAPPLSAFFEHPVLSDLAARLEAGEDGSTAPDAGPAPPRPDPSRAPLGKGQRRLWLLHRLDPRDPSYNVLRWFRVRGDLSLPRLARALAVLAARHEVLRARFVAGADGPEQRFDAAGPSPPAVVDLRRLPATAREAAAQRVATTAELRPFALAEEAPLRALVLRLDDDRHRLVLTLHHIAADAWAVALLVRELAALYSGQALAPAPSFGDLAARQAADGGDGPSPGEIDFHRRRLEGLEPLELPSDRPRPASRDFRGTTTGLALEPAAPLRALARSEGATPFVLHLALVFAWLARLTGRRDLAVGTPVLERDRPGLQALVGFLADTVVIRTAVAPRASFRELLRAVRAAVLETVERRGPRAVPFERLVEALRPDRDPGVHPFFQVLFVDRPESPDRVPFGDTTLERLPRGRHTAKLDLTVELDARSRGLVEVATDLFDPATARRLARQLETVASAVAADSERAVDGLDLLSPAQRHQVVVEWAGRGDRTDGLLHGPFEERARTTPGAVAIADGAGGTLSYGELERRANRLAHRLIAAGAGAESPVAICARRRPELVVALLAISKAGAFYVPLDPAYPAPHLAFLLRDSGARTLLLHRELGSRLPPEALPDGADGGTAGSHVLFLDDEEEARAGHPATPPPCPATPDGLAYLIYTSGSTGRPKAVAIRHGGAAALLSWSTAELRPEETAGVLASTSVCFDLSVFEIFGTLAAGGTVVLAEGALELPRLAPAVPVTLVNTVPSAMAALLDQDGLPATVRTVCLAGEPYPRPLAERLGAWPGLRRQLNLYGPSEDTTYSTGGVVEPAAPGPPPIGRPLAGSVARVLDRSLLPCPPGVPGELFLGGTALARGYFRRPAITAERFLPDPAAAQPGARVYRTGDRVRWRTDGSLDYLGRLDHQVKLRGFRIELGEVEAALAALDGVAEAAAGLRDDGAGTRLVAWIAGREGSETPDERSLRTALAERLPGHLVPQRIVVLDALPRTRNGKLDRAALPAVAGEAAPGTEYVEPRTPVEQLVAGLWRDVLGVERVGAEDGFFDLGGHSLTAAEAVARLRRILQVDLPVRSIFRHPTAAALASALTSAPEARARVERAAALWLSITDLSDGEVADALARRGAARPAAAEDPSRLTAPDRGEA